MASHFLLTLFHQLFNIFIYSTGDGRILARVHGLIQKEPTQSNNLLLLVPIALLVILDILVRHQEIPIFSQRLMDLRYDILLAIS
jgi:hypothetical protein